MAFYKGARKVKVVGHSASFYEKYTSTNLFVERPFLAELQTITISNDSNNDNVLISFDGATVEGELYPKESVSLHVSGKEGVYLRGQTGGDEIRIWGW